MSAYKMPYLEPYHGRDSRHTCPKCKHQRTLTLYINGETGQPIHPTVGKCDREIKCGYHYTPKEYFRDNPQQNTYSNYQPQVQPPICDELFIKTQKTENISYYEMIKDKIDFIPLKYVINSTSYSSNFAHFLLDYFPREKVMNAVTSYVLGSTRNGQVIFWQIDSNDNVRTGKIMQYNPITGKRIKNQKGAINWVHNILKKRSQVYQNYKLSQCYFGEHLLHLYPDKPVAIVEAEKTAVIGSIHCPDFIWLAAGNLNGLTTAKSKVLYNRHIMLFPDGGCYNKWTEKMQRISSEVHCTMEVSDIVEKHATEQQLEEGYDFADYIIEELSNTNTKSTTPHSIPATKTTDTDSGAKKVSETESMQTPQPEPKALSTELSLMIKKNASLGNLIDKLGLEEIV